MGDLGALASRRSRVPIDRQYFVLAEVERGRGFVERSTSWSERA
jgi:hypothetical protein